MWKSVQHIICKCAKFWFVQHTRKVQHGLVPSDIVQIIGAEGGVVVNGGVHHCMSGVYLRA